MKYTIPLLTILLLFFSACQQGDSASPPYSPQQALSTLRLAGGFQAELLAAEPLISDPVAMEIDDQGRIWVVEMHGYPLDVSGSGVIKLLTDSDGDGRPDQSTVFYDNLILPTGIMRWKEGVIVTDSPDVLYLEDTDGDGKADHREVLLTGFALSNPQHNLNTPRFELDNWIYLGHEGSIGTKRFAEEFGDEGTEIRFPGRPGAPALPRNAGGRMVRFDPLNDRLEALSGKTQFGYSFDPWGHLFNGSNYYYLFHEVIAARYLKRNPHLLVDDPTHNMPAGGPGTEVFPITDAPEHQLLTDVGVMTSGCGTTWYKGGLFGEPYDRVIFTAEPVHNLVHSDIIRDKGATFEAVPQFKNKEFLASTDAWFRPVNFYVGPDGALYVIDYYRKFIEHPEWMSEEMNTSGELYAGSDRGRIYRITPEGTPPMEFTGRLNPETLSGEECVGKLAYPNIWWRRHAQRRLVSENRQDLIPDLRKMVMTSPGGLGRVHALWTLEGLSGVTASLLEELLAHPSPGLRENAIRVAELHLGEMPELEEVLLTMINDPHSKVRYQLLCTLGSLPSEEASEACRRLLLRDLEDAWVHIAALSGVAGREMDWYAALLPQLKKMSGEAAEGFITLLSELIARAGSAEEWSRLLTDATASSRAEDTWWQAATLRGIAEGGSSEQLSRFIPQREKQLIRHFRPGTPAALRSASLDLLRQSGYFNEPSGELISRARTVLTDRSAGSAFRYDAIRVLGWSGALSVEDLQTLIDPAETASVQLAALETFTHSTGTAVCDFLLERWPTLTPELRDAAVDVFMRGAERRVRLLEAVEARTVDPSTIGWRRTVSLLNEWNEPVRRKARQVLEGNETGRGEVVEAYHQALELEGDPARGEVVFQRACAQCHQLSGEKGIAFGPDLAAVRNRTPDAILNDILKPNESIADGYELWILTTKDDQQYAGVVARESPAAITLRDLAGKEVTVAREQIAALKAQPNSAMPNGLEQQITEQEMADLLALLRGR